MIGLRSAKLADISLLEYWDSQPHVIAATGHEDDKNGWDWNADIGNEVPWRELLIAEENECPVGFVQIIDPAEDETHYWGECDPDQLAIDMWIGEADNLRRGLGSRIMQLVLERCFSEPQVTTILIDPRADNVRAHRFYERNGFRFVERRMFGPDECHVMRLTREDWLACKALG